MEMEFENIIKELIKIDGEDKTFASPKVQNYIRKMLIKRGYLIHELNKYKSFNFEPYNNIINKIDRSLLTTISTIPGANIELVVKEIEKSGCCAISFAEKHSEYASRMAKVALINYSAKECIDFLRRIHNIPDEIKLRFADKVYEHDCIDDLRDFLELENVPHKEKIEEKYLEKIDIYNVLNYSKTTDANIRACSNALLNSYHSYYDWQEVNYDFVEFHQSNPNCNIARHLKVAKEKLPNQIPRSLNDKEEKRKAKKYIQELEEIYNFHQLSDKDKKEYLNYELEK